VRKLQKNPVWIQLAAVLCFVPALASPAWAQTPTTGSKAVRTCLKARRKTGRIGRKCAALLTQRAYRAPLMPPRELSDESPDTQAAPPTEREPSSEREPFRLGIEGGGLGRGNTTAPDALGLQLYWGARLTSVVPLWDRLILRPGAGYFARWSTVAVTNVWESRVELNANLQFIVLRDSGFRWLIGAQNTAPITFQRITTGGSNTWSTPLVTYQLGPSTAIIWDLGPFTLVIDSEVTFNLSTPVYPMWGLMAGILF